jgi:hypothetical protein
MITVLLVEIFFVFRFKKYKKLKPQPKGLVSKNQKQFWFVHL